MGTLKEQVEEAKDAGFEPDVEFSDDVGYGMSVVRRDRSGRRSHYVYWSIVRNGPRSYTVVIHALTPGEAYDTVLPSSYRTLKQAAQEAVRILNVSSSAMLRGIERNATDVQLVLLALRAAESEVKSGIRRGR